MAGNTQIRAIVTELQNHLKTESSAKSAHGRIKGQGRDTTETYPEKSDTTVMHPWKVVYIIGG